MILKRLFSSSSNDPVAKLFFNPKMQESLKSLTVVTPEKTLRPHRFGSRVRKNPNYVFLTTKQLQEAQKEAREKATKMTQMPPVMSARSNDTGNWNINILISRIFFSSNILISLINSTICNGLGHPKSQKTKLTKLSRIEFCQKNFFAIFNS